jgi:hypothetical protein
MAGQSQGAQSQLCMDSALPIDSNSIPLHFTRSTLAAKHELIDDGSESMRGSRSHIEERVGTGLIDVSGSVFCNPTPDELDNWLPFALGTAESTDTFSVAEGGLERWFMFDNVAKGHTFNSCYCDKMIVSGTKGKPIQFEFRIIGTSPAESAAATFPSLTFSTQRGYSFHEGVLTMQSTAHLFDRFVLIVDNMVEREYNNSPTATDIVPKDRAVWLYTSTPYTSTETGLLTTPAALTGTWATFDPAGAASTLVFTNGNLSTTFTLGNLKLYPRTPSIPGKKQIRLPIRGKAYKNGSTDEIEVTNDSTA